MDRKYVALSLSFGRWSIYMIERRNSNMKLMKYRGETSFLKSYRPYEHTRYNTLYVVPKNAKIFTAEELEILLWIENI